MPSIYISPSLQEEQQFITGTGSEEYYMNLITDAMIPDLNAWGIKVKRNNPFDTLSEIIRKSNAGNYDLHIALHSNTAPAKLAGYLKGPEVYYQQGNNRAKNAANIFAEKLKDVYPHPDFVTSIPIRTLAELSKTNTPTILVELGYHDNNADANWIIESKDAIARNLAQATAKFLGIAPAR